MGLKGIVVVLKKKKETCLWSHQNSNIFHLKHLHKILKNTFKEFWYDAQEKNNWIS